MIEVLNTLNIEELKKLNKHIDKLITKEKTYKKLNMVKNKEGDKCAICKKLKGEVPISCEEYKKTTEYWICSECDENYFDWEVYETKKKLKGDKNVV